MSWQPETEALEPLLMESPLEFCPSKMQTVTESEQLEAEIPTSFPRKVQADTASVQLRTCRASKFLVKSEPVIVAVEVSTSMPLVLPSALGAVPAPLTRHWRSSRTEPGAARKW